MKLKALVPGFVSAVLLGPLAIGAMPAAAEPHANAPNVADVITVVAPRVERTRAPAGVATMITARAEAVVNLSDLDLARTADVFELESRIAEAAVQLCERLAQEYPFAQPRTSVCIRRAVNNAMAIANEAVQQIAVR
jgi:UrcA family protein